eukprot:204487_1
MLFSMLWLTLLIQISTSGGCWRYLFGGCIRTSSSTASKNNSFVSVHTAPSRSLRRSVGRSFRSDNFINVSRSNTNPLLSLKRPGTPPQKDIHVFATALFDTIKHTLHHHWIFIINNDGHLVANNRLFDEFFTRDQFTHQIAFWSGEIEVLDLALSSQPFMKNHRIIQTKSDTFMLVDFSIEKIQCCPGYYSIMEAETKSFKFSLDSLVVIDNYDRNANYSTEWKHQFVWFYMRSVHDKDSFWFRLIQNSFKMDQGPQIQRALFSPGGHDFDLEAFHVHLLSMHKCLGVSSQQFQVQPLIMIPHTRKVLFDTEMVLACIGGLLLDSGRVLLQVPANQVIHVLVVLDNNPSNNILSMDIWIVTEELDVEWLSGVQFDAAISLINELDGKYYVSSEHSESSVRFGIQLPFFVDAESSETSFATSINTGIHRFYNKVLPSSSESFGSSSTLLGALEQEFIAADPLIDLLLNTMQMPTNWNFEIKSDGALVSYSASFLDIFDPTHWNDTSQGSFWAGQMNNVSNVGTSTSGVRILESATGLFIVSSYSTRKVNADTYQIFEIRITFMPFYEEEDIAVVRYNESSDFEYTSEWKHQFLFYYFNCYAADTVDFVEKRMFWVVFTLQNFAWYLQPEKCYFDQINLKLIQEKHAPFDFEKILIGLSSLHIPLGIKRDNWALIIEDGRVSNRSSAVNLYLVHRCIAGIMLDVGRLMLSQVTHVPRDQVAIYAEIIVRESEDVLGSRLLVLLKMHCAVSSKEPVAHSVLQLTRSSPNTIQLELARLLLKQTDGSIVIRQGSSDTLEIVIAFKI